MKKLLNLIIILILGITINVKASTNTYDRESLPNYGVNKKWEINDSNLDNILNTYAVNASEKIYDFSDILTETEEKELKKIIDKFTIKYKTDIVILTDNLKYISDYENEEFACDFYDYNDFGIEYNNSGILLFRNTYSSDPYYNMYIFGDAKLYMSTDRIEATLDNLYEYLPKKEYYAGFTRFVNDITLYYSQGVPNNINDYTASDYSQDKFIVPWAEVISTTLIVTSILMFILIKKNYMITKETRAHKYINRYKSKITNRKDVFLSSSTKTYDISTGLAAARASSTIARASSRSISRGGIRIGSSGGTHRSGSGRHG